MNLVSGKLFILLIHDQEMWQSIKLNIYACLAEKIYIVLSNWELNKENTICAYGDKTNSKISFLQIKSFLMSIQFTQMASNVKHLRGMESIKLLMSSCGILSHSSITAFFSSWRVYMDLKQSAMLLPRISTGFYVLLCLYQKKTRWIFHPFFLPSKRKSSTNLTPCELQLASISMISYFIAAA